MSYISSLSACLAMAMRSVRESMHYDSQDRKKEAFCQYLSNVIHICSVLKDEAWEKDLKGCYSSQETLKLFKLSSQCLERAQDLLGNSEATDDTVPLVTSPLVPKDTPSRKISQESSFQYPVESQPNSLAHVKKLHIPSSPVSPRFKRRIEYVDEARRGNTQLLSAYRARMEKREKQSVGNTRLRKTDLAASNLRMFRKMSENIEIAKARQKSLGKRKFERQQRLREAADRRMGPSSSLTTDEQIKKEMYVKILEFEQETLWLTSLRDQLMASPEDSTLIQHIINQVLGASEHPLTKCLQSYQFEIHNQLTTVSEQARDLLEQIANLENLMCSTDPTTVTDESEENRKQELDERKEISFDEELRELVIDTDNETVEVVDETSMSSKNADEVDDAVFSEDERAKEYKCVLETVVKNVHFALEILNSMFLLIYEPFSSPAGQDLCLASVECAFFRPLWPQLLNLYRVVNYTKEARLAKVFQKNATCTPESLNVPDRLCLEDQIIDGENSIYPYQLVVDELQSLTIFDCPLEKLECIVRTNRVIVECVEDHFEAKGSGRNSSETVIGCDDLLPILCYVIIRSGLPQLVSECHAMEDFISTDYLMGEEGYSLTTLQTALAYLETLEGS